MIGLDNVFNDKKTRMKVGKIFAAEHILIHRAGLSDPKFKRITKSKGAINTQIELSRKFILDSIALKRLMEESYLYLVDSPK